MENVEHHKNHAAARVVIAVLLGALLFLNVVIPLVKRHQANKRLAYAQVLILQYEAAQDPLERDRIAYELAQLWVKRPLATSARAVVVRDPCLEWSKDMVVKDASDNNFQGVSHWYLECINSFGN